MRALLVLGLNYDQPLVRIQAISDQQNIPKRFLEQILNDLRSRIRLWCKASGVWAEVISLLGGPKKSPWQGDPAH